MPDSLFARAQRLYKGKDYADARQVFGDARQAFEAADNFELALEAVYKMAYCDFYTGDFLSGVGLIDSALPLFREKLSDTSFLVAKLLILKGVSCRRLEDYGNALEAYEQAINVYEALDTVHANVVYAYRNAAQIYSRRLDYRRAILYLEKALEKDVSGDSGALLHSLLADNYAFLGDYDKALRHVEAGMATRPHMWYEILLKQAGANAWFHKGDFDRAEKWYAEALAGMRDHPEFGMEMWKVYKDLGDVFRRKGDTRRAEEMYEAAIQSAYDYYKPFKNRELAKLNCQLGTYALDSGDLDRALAFFQEAMIQVFPEFNNADPAANPTLAEVYTESWIMDACAGKGRTLHARYLRTGEETDLINAAQCFDLAIAGVRQLKQSLGNDAAKIYLGDFSHAFFEEAIAVNFLLWKKRKAPVFIEKIFELMEGSKSSTLQNALQLNQAVIFAGVDKDLLRREEFLRVSMAEYQKRIQEERMKGETKDTSQILVYRKKIGDLEREYDQLLQKIGEEDPRFKSAMREVVPVPLSDFRHHILAETDRVLEFFMGKNNLYILSFDRQYADVRALPLASGVYNELFEWLARFQKPEAMNADYADFLQTGHLLFNQLFGDLAFPSDRPLKLLVIPDGIAAILPFEALNLTPPGASPVFLIERAELRMAYSASVLTQQENWPVKTKEWVHFAPEFRTGVRGLSPLLYSARETEGVYGMTTFSGASASLSAFLEWAPRCAWIHLSTHARSGGNGVAPHVEFYDSTLYLPGIYALRLSAEMVILSTCESGLGTIEKGEGVMSLARGFSYAGAKSLISSLWEVNEFSTAGIFSGFYQYLKKGKTRAEAMRLAKLDYLRSPDRPAFEKTPWYWAGFMLIGVDGPVRHQSPVRAGFYGLCLVLAGVVWVIWRRRRSAGHSSLRRA